MDEADATWRLRQIDRRIRSCSFKSVGVAGEQKRCNRNRGVTGGPNRGRDDNYIFFFWMCHAGSLQSVQFPPLNIFAASTFPRVCHSSHFTVMAPNSPPFAAPKV